MRAKEEGVTIAGREGPVWRRIPPSTHPDSLCEYTRSKCSCLRRLIIQLPVDIRNTLVEHRMILLPQIRLDQCSQCILNLLRQEGKLTGNLLTRHLPAAWLGRS